MSLTATDFQALVAEVEEARAILARQAELEQEIAKAEKRLRKLVEAQAAAESTLDTLEQKTAGAQSHFEHERSRFTLDLRAHVEECEQGKKQAGLDAAAALVSLNADIEAFRARCTTEKRQLESEVNQLRGERTGLAAACVEFKRQIAALPE